MNKLFLSIFLFLSMNIQAQKRSLTYNYIERFGLTAINTMHDSKIPASVIMAIAIEESASGTSEVAINANNHFGLKAGSSYKGKTYRTKGNSLFRAFENEKLSFEAFAVVIAGNKNQYGFLFKYPKTDYKNWIKGIGKSGYCQGDSGYAKRLLAIIEEHELYHFDECFWEFK
jgi:flagellum-specific peptidoglycan hydrolase FlgJ